MSNASDSLLETVAALKHDLGKYVAWTSANLTDEAWADPVSDELIGALRGDILETRKGRDGVHESAWEVWGRFRERLPSGLPPELASVEGAVERLEALAPILETSDRAAIGANADSIRDAQATIRSELRALHRRLVRENAGDTP